MMEKTYKILKIVILVLLIMVLIAGAYVLYGKLSGQVQVMPDILEETEGTLTPTPDFTFYDLEGNAYALSDFQGKPVILNFWASWCGFCKTEMPEFQNAFDTYGDEVHFLMMDVADGRQETKESGAAYIEEAGYTFPVYYDTDLAGALAYGARSLPMTFFVDADGNLVSYQLGAMTGEALQKGIDMLLK